MRHEKQETLLVIYTAVKFGPSGVGSSISEVWARSTLLFINLNQPAQVK